MLRPRSGAWQWPLTTAALCKESYAAVIFFLPDAGSVSLCFTLTALHTALDCKGQHQSVLLLLLPVEGDVGAAAEGEFVAVDAGGLQPRVVTLLERQLGGVLKVVNDSQSPQCSSVYIMYQLMCV